MDSLSISYWRFHRQVAEHLKQMILDDVADCAGLIVEATTALDTKIFGHGDLHALDIVSVPERFHEGVRETKYEHVLHRPLPQVMVDSENCAFIEMPQKNLIEISCRFQVVTEGLLDDDPSLCGAAAVRQVFHNSLEHRRKDSR